jgi:hypothetical protein
MMCQCDRQYDSVHLRSALLLSLLVDSDLKVNAIYVLWFYLIE